jgi:hypothetical protein
MEDLPRLRRLMQVLELLLVQEQEHVLRQGH